MRDAVIIVLSAVVVLQGAGLVYLWREVEALRRAFPVYAAEDILQAVAQDTDPAGAPVTESALVREWRAEMDALPEGSPRRVAYEARLRELGAL